MVGVGMVRSSKEISREIRPGSGQVAPVEPAPPKGPTDIGGLNLPEVGSQSLHSSNETGEQKTVERREVGRLMRDGEIGNSTRITVAFRSRPIQETLRNAQWTYPQIWTERMLATLHSGVKG